MSSPSLPSPASLEPGLRPRGFVTARSVLADIHITPPDGPAADQPHSATGALKQSRRKPTRPDSPAPEPPSRNKSATNHAAPATTTTTRQKAAPKSDPDHAQPAPKRSRAKKTAATDTTDAPKPAAKRGRKKKAEPDDVDEKPPPKPRRTKAATKKRPSSSEHPQALDLDPAPRGRRDWTPPPDLGLPPSFQRSSHASPAPDTAQSLPSADCAPDADASDTLDFANLMGNFGYQQETTPQPPLSRQNSHQPTTKRKRLDPVDEPQKRKKESEPRPKPPKKPRAPKKKPITITALATAAYRAQAPEDASEQPKLISDFFGHPQNAPDTAPEADSAAGPSSKSASRQNNDAKPAPKRKRAKKVHIVVPPPPPIKLDSPETARENMKKQQWLFGSSSQLAAAESPTEVRHLQRALKESEEMIPSQQGDPLHATSYMRVPSAPHGTSLSIGQAYRVLWMSAARDFEDSTFASDESQDMPMQEDSNHLPPVIVDAPDLAGSAPPEQSKQDVVPPSEIIAISSSATPPRDGESMNSGYVDIDDIGDVPEMASLPNRLPPPDAETVATTASETGQVSREANPLDTPPGMEAALRPVLGARDPNTSLSKSMVDISSKALSPSEPIAKASTISEQSPEKRPRGRPPKVITDSGLTSPKPRGRPRKLVVSPGPASPARPRGRPHKALTSPASTSSPKIKSRPLKLPGSPGLISPARQRGRPRKSPSPAALPASSQLLKLPLVRSATPRATGKTVVDNSSDYLDIDDIEDPDLVHNTLSPPRRLPTSPPKATLDLDRPLPAAVVSTAPRSSKQLQAEFTIIAITLFPRITQMVKSTSPSRDPKNPTWHEKMLLYDPIVLEDLTAWLNAQGVRIESTRPKPIEKGKKGKKKADETRQEDEMKVVKEELQPWMVQKWCEEHSVCCLWKEGLRGGVRHKY